MNAVLSSKDYYIDGQNAQFCLGEEKLPNNDTQTHSMFVKL